MIDFTQEEVRLYYESRTPGVSFIGRPEIRTKCPIHDGEGENFAIDARTGMAHCHSQCQKGWDILGLEMELFGKDFPTSKKEVFSVIGRPAPSYADRDIVSSFDYTDRNGNLLYQVIRRFPKKFGQRRPEGAGWAWNLGDMPRVPFQLASLVNEQVVHIVEGEKDALNLTSRGFFATCNSEGAGKWRSELTQWFKGRRVFIIPDNDQPGRDHAIKVAKALNGVASLVRVVELPDLPAKGDVSDFFASGKTVEEFKKALSDSQPYMDGFQFASVLANEEDKWVRTAAQVVSFYGQNDRFWNMTEEEGIPTPYASLTEDLSGGLRKGEVYILAGPRGEGKTSLLLQFISKACRLSNGVLLFSLEMGDKDVTRRLVSIEERVDLAQFRILQKNRAAKSISQRDDYTLRLLTAKLFGGTDRVTKYPLLVHQRPSVSPHYLIEETKRLVARQRIDLLCVDHAQLMSSTGNEQKDYEKFTAISRALKGEVARELQIPVLVVSQINRSSAIEKRGELEITDLRGSGAWEEDAAAVFLLYHNAEHVAALKASGQLSKGPVRSHLKLGKNRFGSTGTYLDLMHYKGHTRFESMDDRDFESQEEAQSILGAA